jgi:hypothetical protein
MGVGFHFDGHMKQRRVVNFQRRRHPRPAVP